MATSRKAKKSAKKTVSAKEPSAAAIKKAQAQRAARNAALKVAADKVMPLVQDPEPPRAKRQRRPPPPPPPNPTVLKLQEQIVPLVDNRSETIRQISMTEGQIAQVTATLHRLRGQLQSIEAEISYRLQVIGQIEGRPVEQYATPIRPLFAHISEVARYPTGEDLERRISSDREIELEKLENDARNLGRPTSLAGVSSIPSGRPPALGVQAVGGDPRFPEARSESAEEERRAM